jgi:RNA polymerase sigma-70 factor (ECF subfamily)
VGGAGAGELQASRTSLLSGQASRRIELRGHNSARRTLRRDHSAAPPGPLRDQVEYLSDEALVELAARRDAKAVGEFYDRYGHIAYGLALSVLGDPRSAEAVVEDAFAILGRTNGHLAASGTSASTWILALVHRQAVERLRSTHRAGEARLAIDGRQTTGGDDGVGLQSGHTQCALDELTAAQREMLVLAYYGGLTASELAARFEQRLDAVTATLHAGLSRLRDALGEETAYRSASARGPDSAPAPELRRRGRSPRPRESER